MTGSIMKLLNNYYRATPKKWRKIGDSLSAAAFVVVEYSLTDHTLLRIIVAALFIGKFLTNLFKEDK
jgi:hypothetical protein